MTKNGLPDFHLHTMLSDGTDTPAELLAKVKEAGIEYFSITDHDSIIGGSAIRPYLKEDDPRFITGVEFSCKDSEGKYHILGYGYNPEAQPIKDVVNMGHGYRIKKAKARVEYLKEKYNFDFPKEELEEFFSLSNPGKPHLGNMMVKHGYAASKEEAIRDFIDGVHFKSEYVKPEEAIAGIIGAGGIPVLAHPFYGSGDQLILGEEMEQRLRKLIDYGLQGIEGFYSGFTEKLRNSALALAEKYNLFVTAGSDYHGKNKLVVLGDTGIDENTVYPEGLNRFLEEVKVRCIN